MDFDAKSVFAAVVLSLLGSAIPGSSATQIQMVSTSYFPAEMEFKELRSVRSEKGAVDSAGLGGLKEAPIFAEAGFAQYWERTYLTDLGSDLSIEVIKARDERAAYSLFTLFRSDGITKGPPGDVFSAGGSSQVFAKGVFWVRVRGAVPPDLLRRIALSVGNRIGPQERSSVPSLVSRFPQNGLETGTMRYFLGPMALEYFGSGILGTLPELGPEMEIAQARYAAGGTTAILSLLGFPTNQAAESYFANVSLPSSAGTSRGAIRSYARRVGPIVGVLEGDLAPEAAQEILGALKYTYSIRWIYDKNNRSTATVWGVPVGILGTVVRSLFLTALLCGLSLALGTGMALFRVFLRNYAPNNFLDRPERTGMIRLRLSEGPTHPVVQSDQSEMDQKS